MSKVAAAVDIAMHVLTCYFIRCIDLIIESAFLFLAGSLSWHLCGNERQNFPEPKGMFFIAVKHKKTKILRKSQCGRIVKFKNKTAELFYLRQKILCHSKQFSLKTLFFVITHITLLANHKLWTIYSFFYRLVQLLSGLTISLII